MITQLSFTTFNILLVLAISATVVWLAAWLLSTFFARRSAAQRHRIWAWSMITVMVAPLIVSWLPVPHVLWSPSQTVVESTPPKSEPLKDVNAVAPATVSQPSRIDRGRRTAMGPDMLSAPAFESPNNSIAALEDSNASNNAPPPSLDPTENSARRPIEIWSLIVPVWGIGFFIGIALLVRSRLRCRKMISEALAVEDTESLKLLSRLRSQLGVRAQVRLVVSAEAEVPFLTGWISPVIFMPAGFGQWSADRLSVVLTHELTHIRRSDMLWQNIGSLSLAIAWFHPLAWVASWQLREEREHACDDAVIRSGTCAVEYAAHLVEIASALHRRRIFRASVVAMAGTTGVEKRVKHVLNRYAGRSPVTWKSNALTLLFLTVALSFGAMLSPAENAQETTDAGDKTSFFDISGRTIDADGNPISGARISAHVVGVDPVESGSNGEFSLSVAEGSWLYLEASDSLHRMCRTGWLHAKSADALKNTDLVLKPAGRIFGQVVRGADTPAPNVQLMLGFAGPPGREARKTADGNTISNGYGQTTNTNKFGQFEYFMPPGEYTLSPHTFEVGKRTVTIRGAEQREINFSLIKQVPLKIRVVTGGPGNGKGDQENVVKDATIVLHSLSDESAGTTLSLKDGTLETVRDSVPAIALAHNEDKSLIGVALLAADQVEASIDVAAPINMSLRLVNSNGQLITTEPVTYAIENRILGENADDSRIGAGVGVTDKQGVLQIQNAIPGCPVHA